MSPISSSRTLWSLASAAAVTLALATGSARADDRPATSVPGEVVVDVHGDTTTEPHIIRTDDVSGTIAALRERDDVRYAVPNAIAHAAQAPQFVPNDPGLVGAIFGWRATQWNLDGPYSINAITGWNNLIAAGAPGAEGVKIAVLDSGIAYRADPPRRATPELPRKRFLQGYDFVDGDSVATDEFGHGTQVASIIGAETDNKIGLAGIAYRSRIMPVRVLDRDGAGDAVAIARGIRFAAKHGAQVINMSLEFPEEYTARDIPQVLDALAFARKRGVVVVAAAGNEGLDRLPYPGRATGVIAVGAITQRGCAADYSNTGSRLDLVAPGGGADGEYRDKVCKPAKKQGKGITQLSLVGPGHTVLKASTKDGTSMASPQVAAVAAAIIASGVLGSDPKPESVEWRLRSTARNLGPKGYDRRYGHGLVDFAAATAPRAAPAPPSGP